VEKWVLPLTILPDPSYTLNTYKGRHKALLWIMPFNDFSGIYNAASMYVYFGDNTTKYMTASTREARVVQGYHADAAQREHTGSGRGPGNILVSTSPVFLFSKRHVLLFSCSMFR
jgi:hypothetical protein